MKLSIYYGASKPLTAIGRNQCRLLSFAEKYPTWHSFYRDKIPPEAKGLIKRGCIIINEFNQFKINY